MGGPADSRKNAFGIAASATKATACVALNHFACERGEGEVKQRARLPEGATAKGRDARARRPRARLPRGATAKGRELPKGANGETAVLANHEGRRGVRRERLSPGGPHARARDDQAGAERQA
jgi:hypothetical protein